MDTETIQANKSSEAPAALAGTVTEAERVSAMLVARMERIPELLFHQKARAIVGSATFFDAFDALTIAFVLPVLVRLWHLTPVNTGLIISSGYVGQAAGAIFFGWVAEKKGRLFSLQGTIILVSLFSLLCAAAQDYNQLFVFRLLQGIGLGGEVPVAAAYINEITKAQGRGRFVLLFQWSFSVGIWFTTVLGAAVVPHLGWRAMFVIGALPALCIVFLRRGLPESPRWLANHGRLAEAEEAAAFIEAEAIRRKKALPEPVMRPAVAVKKTRFQELFEGVYARRTIAMWFMWFGSYFFTYGLYQTWGPTILTTIFKLSLPDALNLGALVSTVNLPVSFFIYWNGDKIPRRLLFITSLIGGGVLLLVLGLWSSIGGLLLAAYICLMWLTTVFVGVNNLGLYLYNPEVYPTRLRALGTSIATAWLRVASAVGPALTGFIIAVRGLIPVFYLVAVVLLISGAVAYWGAPETRGRVLEEVSP